MTVLTMPTEPGHDSRPRPVPWRRMAWVTWRLHRTMLIGALLMLSAAAAYLLVTGLDMHHGYAAVTACRPASSDACLERSGAFFAAHWQTADFTLELMSLLPALIGAFAGAPVLARELETGTFRYSWTQGLSRERSTIARLLLLAVAVTAAAAALGELFAWYFQPVFQLGQRSPLDANVFGTHGVAFAAWTLAAFALGAFLGMLIRRTVPAMAATLGAYLGLNVLARLVLRPHYLPAAVTSNSAVTGPSPWILGYWWAGPGGKPADMSFVNQVIQRFTSNPPPNISMEQFLAQHGYTYWYRYIPVSRFWPMQFVEGGWLLALSVLLITATVFLVRRRAA